MKPFNRYIIILIFLTKAVLGYAPDQLTGYKLDQTDTYYIFLSESIMDEHDVEEGAIRPGRSYTYVKDGDNTGTLSKPYADGLVDTYDLLFTSSSGGVITNDSNWPFTFTRNEQATTTSLDGSIFILSSSDGVSETLSFENGTFTSAFVDSQKSTTIISSQSYILDSMSSNSWKITLNNGNIYSFDSSAGTGSLTDYENGVIDTSGSWTFTFKQNTWMDYDDFSGSTLDTNKWEVGYFAGGETVTIVNGQAKLSGSAYSSSSPIQMPSDFANAGQDATSGNTFLLIKDPTIIGLEADITIPNAGNQNEAGIYLSTTDMAPFGSLGFELLKTATGSSFNYDYFNDQGGKILGYEAGSLDTLHKIKITELNGQTSYYLDNKLIKQFSSTSHDTDYWGIGSFSDNGMAYITYADNVRVLRNWEDYDDFSGSTLDTTKWDLSQWDGGIVPALEGSRLKFSGQANSSSSVNIATSAMLASSSNVSERVSNFTSPHSILEFKESQNLKGIELTFSIPSGVPNKMGFGLYATNYQAMFNSQSDSEEESAIPFNMDLWADNSLAATLEFDAKDPTTGIEQGIDKSISFDSSYRVSFIRGDSQISFYMDGELVGEFPYSDVGEYFIVRAKSEINQTFTTYLDNVRVLRRSSGSPSIKVAPLALSAFRDKVYLQGQNGPVEIDGASEINFDLQLIGQPTVSAATMTVDSVTYDLASFQAPAAFRTNYGYSSFDDELFDVESSSESDWNPYINGKTFNFNITVDGITYSYAHNLPAESSLPSTPNTSLAESSGWKTDSDGYEYQEARAGNSLTLTWDTFSLASSDDFITVSVEELVGDNEIEVMGSTSLPVTATSYEFPSNLFESGKKYTLYVAFHKVTQSDNPTGFEHQVGSDTAQTLLVTMARSVTAMDVNIVDVTPTSILSDGNGQVVIVQVGDEYKWNSTLDGVTLWVVGKDGNNWSLDGTTKFENGKQLIVFSMVDSINGQQTYSHSYSVDENGYLRVLEDDGDFQYYNPVSVENGVIGMIGNDEGVDSVANNGINQVDQWFFTTRAAAEEYYYSKVGYPNPKGWLWFDQYPWVYSSEEQGWLYFMPSGGKLMYYSHKSKVWREFNQ